MNHLPGGDGVCARRPYLRYQQDALLTDIPLQTGYSPLRWRVAIDALLLKKYGVTLIEKLRIIVLFQGDFNYLNKYIGCHMMKYGEACEQLAW
jgi:hypothetical protein